MADGQYTFNGWTFGDEQNGVTVNEWTGVDLPDVVDHDLPRHDGWGLFAGIDFYGGRSFICAGDLWGTDAAGFETNLDLMRRATVVQSSELPLVFDLPGQVAKRIDCRPRRRRIPINHAWAALQAARFVIEWSATDPRFYSDSAVTTPIALSGTETLTNSGDVATKWTATISGPVTNPRLAHENGLALDFDANGGLVVPSGQDLVVDFRARTAVLNGTTNAFPYLDPTSEFFELAVGDNDLTFTATAGSGSCSMSHRHAWGALT